MLSESLRSLAGKAGARLGRFLSVAVALLWPLLGVLILELTPAQAAPKPDNDPESEHSDGGPQRTGLPLPRFASLSSNKVNIRRGPGKIYPVDWVFIRKGMPVEITAEWELWRKIRDSDGTSGWVHKSMLAGQRTAMIRGEIRTLYRKPDPASGAIARAEPGVMGKIMSCHAEWCRLDLGQARGWLPKSEIWGAYPDEEVD
jgi:SH3-like domain-containing protein